LYSKAWTIHETATGEPINHICQILFCTDFCVSSGKYVDIDWFKKVDQKRKILRIEKKSNIAVMQIIPIETTYEKICLVAKSFLIFIQTH